MANDHFVTRSQTARWETGQRRLHFFDFDRDALDQCSSETLFAKHNLHSNQTGQLLNRIVETPLSQYLARTFKVGTTLFDPGNWSVYRAIVGLTCLQVQRTADANGRETTQSLDIVLARGEEFLDELAQVAREQNAIFGLSLPASEQLFFPSTGFFAMPMIGERPAYGFPVSPQHLFVLADKGCEARQLEEWMRIPGMVSTSSVGIGANVSKVLIPPSHHPKLAEDPQGLTSVLKEMRNNAFDMFQLIGSANYTVGFSAWMPDPVHTRTKRAERGTSP